MTPPGGGDADTPITPEAARELLERAKEARRHAYAPYSGFPVGAALLAGSGAIVTGCNVENAAYPLSLCAERVALGSAVALGVETPGGEHAFTAIAVVGPDDSTPCWPCGSCRQALSEFSPDLWVISPGRNAEAFEMLRLSELLPHPFGPRTLEGR